MFAPHRYRNATSQVSDPNFENVSLLLHGDGTNGAQNNTFLDSSTNNFTITRNGTPTQGSFSPYGNSWSNYFNGTTDYLYVPDNDAFHLTGDFTIEGWVYQTASKDVTIVGQWGGGSEQSFIFRIEATGKLSFAYDLGSGGINAAQSSSSIIYNSWNHVAFVRSGSTVRYYINGVQDSVTNTVSGAFRNAAQPIVIGLYNTLVNTYFNGYISNLRFVKGTALYTSNFTPPTSNLTAVAGTSLLTCQSNRFIDNSSNNFTITANGTPSVQLNSPFNPTSEYSITANGGSGYFNGINNFLTVPSNNVFSFGTGDFTVEYWAYYPSFSNTNGKTIIDSRPLGINGNYWNTGLNNTGMPGFTTMTSGGVTLSATQSYPNQWIHIAATRNSGTLRLFINGTQVAISSGNVDNISSSGLAIGANAFRGTAPDTYFGGNISNLRIIKGTALYTSNFTPPTSPVTAVANTSLLCNFTNAGIFDNAAKNNLLTVGNARVSTAQKKYGSGSMLFNGSTDYCRTIALAGTHQFGTGDFTIECWVYCTNLAGGSSNTMEIIDFRSSTGNEARPTLAIQNSQFLYYTNGSNRIVSSTISANTWYHVAVVRSSGSTKLYVNGTNVGVTYADTVNYLDGTPTIGNYLPQPIFGFAGYIDDVRITKGITRYTANFTPPTQAFPNL